MCMGQNEERSLCLTQEASSVCLVPTRFATMLGAVMWCGG